MPINLQVQSNGGLPNSSRSSSRAAEELIWTLKVEDDSDKLRKFLVPYPAGQLNCTSYARTGVCRYGTQCRFNHDKDQRVLYLGGPERFGEPDCMFYLKRGTCSFGPNCRYHHQRDRYGAGPLLLNSLDLPIRQGEMSCKFYLKNGHCKYGVACRYNHPELATIGTSPDSRYTIHGPTGSSAAPLHHPSSLSPAASYNSGQHSQSPETYMPLVISPAQRLAPAHGWNSYLGYTRPISYASVHGPAVIYNPNPGALNCSSSMNAPPTYFYQLPERPDQPECRDFVNTGTCKYGSACKYYHPRGKNTRMGTYLAAPFGLSFRPGQALSSRLSFYGLWKYGQTVRYGFPSGGYFYSNGLSSASVGGFGQSFWYQKSSPSFHLPGIFSKPSTVSVTVRKPEVVASKKQNLETETREASNEQNGFLEQSLPTGEPASDHSDC